MPSSPPWLAPSHADSAAWPVILAIRGPGFGAETEPTPAADAAAWTLIALLVFCVVWIAATVLIIKRRLGKQEPPEDFQDVVKTQPESQEPRAAWQKPEDWWKH